MNAIIQEKQQNTTVSKKLVYGVGINDSDYVIRKCLYYKIWTSMLSRCYSKKVHDIRETYRRCTVCDEWLIFSNFRTWMINQDHANKQLDKDILATGNKIYSPSTCIFVSAEINLLFTHIKSTKGIYPTGVRFNKRDGKFTAQISINGKDVALGYFDNVDSAEIAYQKAKIKHAYQLAAKEPDKRIADAIRRYCQTFKYFMLAEVIV